MLSTLAIDHVKNFRYLFAITSQFQPWLSSLAT